MIDTVFSEDDARVPTITVGAGWQLAQDMGSAA